MYKLYWNNLYQDYSLTLGEIMFNIVLFWVNGILAKYILFWFFFFSIASNMSTPHDFPY